MAQFMDINEIKKILPHRDPFLFVDAVTDIGPDFIVGYKNVSINEPFFKGHFPGQPIMPGVLVIEALAQMGAIFLLRDEKRRGKTPLFLGIDRVRFRRQVLPGEVLKLEVRILQSRGDVFKVEGKASVNGAIACEAWFIAGTK